RTAERGLPLTVPTACLRRRSAKAFRRAGLLSRGEPERPLPASGAPALGRQQPCIHPEGPQRRPPLVLVLPAENQLRRGVADQPAVLADLGLELPRTPAGIAQRQDRVAGTLAAGYVLQDVERRGH